MADSLDVVVEQLLAVYRAAQARIDAEMAAIADDPTRFARRARLLAIEARVGLLMDEVDQQARQWVDSSLPRIYAAGLRNGGESNWTLTNREAVSHLADDLFGDLLKATTYVRESTKVMVREVIRSGVTTGTVLGETATQMGQRAAAVLAENGIHSVVYANGREVSLRTYTDMAVRTRTAVAYNLATLSGASGHGVEYFEVGDGPECGWTEHDDPDLAQGTIRTAAECAEYPIAHPNCVRSLLPRPDLNGLSPDDARNAESFIAQINGSAAGRVPAASVRHDARMAGHFARRR